MNFDLDFILLLGYIFIVISIVDCQVEANYIEITFLGYILTYMLQDLLQGQLQLLFIACRQQWKVFIYIKVHTDLSLNYFVTNRFYCTLDELSYIYIHLTLNLEQFQDGNFDLLQSRC